jgi:hypothetical protein
MVLQEKLIDGLNEVDVIIAGGTSERSVQICT